MRVQILRASLIALLFAGTSACSGAQPEPETNPCANPCALPDENPCETGANPCNGTADPGPTTVGGEASKTGADPQESKLTDTDRFDINAVLKANRGDLTSCYDEVLAPLTLPPAGFVIKAAFTIEADGTVAGATIAEASERYEDAEKCFLLNLATIKFPPPPEGRVIETTYPFTIKRK